MTVWDEFKRGREIIPSPGTDNKTWEDIEKKIDLIKPFVKTIHIDILDGKFTNNTTLLDPTPFKKFTSEIFFEVHLMTDNPIQYLKPFADAGFKRFIGQIEKMPDIPEFIAQAQLLGEACIALDKETPLETLNMSYDDIDAILIMTIKAGKSGQTFIEELLEKVKKIHSLAPQLPIEVDGGINSQTLPLALNAGANRFVATSTLFNAPNIQEQYKTLINLIKV